MPLQKVKSEPEDSVAPKSASFDGSDEIVRQIPVYLSPALSKHLNLIQFPLQHAETSSAPEAVRVKPRHCMMELDYPTPENIETFGQFQMTNRTYTSQTIPVSTHMALGKMDANGSMQLVPLSRITQMRPSFAHVDEATMNASPTEDGKLPSCNRQRLER